MNSDAKVKISNARAALIMDQPFFGTLSLKLKITEDEMFTSTMSTNGIDIVYNPNFVKELPLDHLKGVFAHEVLHCVFDHSTRRGERDPEDWNRAGDYAINPVLINAGFKLPDPLYDSKYDGMSAEQIYSLIHKKKPSGKKGKKGKSGDGKNGKNNDPGGCGGVHDPKGPDGKKPMTPTEKKEQENDWKVSVAQAAQQAKTVGSMPGGLSRMIDELFETKIDWKAVLRNFIEKTAKNDYSWKFPNKRYMHLGMYLPSLFSEELGTIVIGVDTSGSVGNRELEQFASEITSILQDFPKLEVEVVYCDTQVAHTEKFTFEDLPLTLTARGGGGTRFTPVFKWIERNNIQPKCLIYFSDMWCNDYPDIPPEYPTLWARTEKNDSYKAPFGEMLDVIIE